ncbi:MAG: hypothetical protein ACNA75_05930 [Thiohalomonadaceae bacterium]
MTRIHFLTVLSLLLLAVLLWLLIPRLAERLVDAESAPLWQYAAAEDCDLHRQACRVDLPGGGWLELSLEPRPVRMLSPFLIRVGLGGLPVDRVTVDFSGVEMEMGYNRPSLRRMADGAYEATGILPMCVDERMSWQARVLLYQADGLGVVSFQFETSRRGDQ